MQRQISPFVGTQSVSQYYSYGFPFVASSDTGNEVSNAAVMFLYEQRIPGQPNVLSFVIILDKADDGSGGSAKAIVTYTVNGVKQTLNNK